MPPLALVCGRHGLVAVPAGIPTSTEYVILPGNRISHLGTATLDNLPHLNVFNIYEYFASTTQLEAITLERNHHESSEDIRKLLCSIRSGVGLSLSLNVALSDRLVLDKMTMDCAENISVMDISNNRMKFLPETLSNSSIRDLRLKSVFHEDLDPSIYINMYD